MPKPPSKPWSPNSSQRVKISRKKARKTPRAIRPRKVTVNAPKKPWVIYVLRCGDGSLYCGITNDLKKRLAVHRAGKGARYTRGRGPLRLRRSWTVGSQSAALRAEIAFKNLNRQAKQHTLTGKRLPPF